MKTKKFLSTLTALMLSATSAMPLFTNAEDRLTGDINNDGLVNGTDALLVLKYYAYISAEQPTDDLPEIENILAYGDVHNDGVINTSDAAFICDIGVNTLDPNEDGVIDMYDMKYIQNIAYNVEDYSLEELQDIASRTAMQPDTIDYHYYCEEFDELKKFFLEYGQTLMKYFEFSVGDTDSDGTIDASDSSAILSAYADISSGKTSEIDTDIYDFNGDGKVNSGDASEVLNYYVLKSKGVF